SFCALLPPALLSVTIMTSYTSRPTPSPRSPLFPYTTLFRSRLHAAGQCRALSREPRGPERSRRPRAAGSDVPTGQRERTSHPGHDGPPGPAYDREASPGKHPRRHVAVAVSGRAAHALGVRVKSGWATAVLVAGPARAPRVVDRRTIELSDPAVPASRQPYHAVMGARAGVAKQVERRLCRIVEQVTR